LLARGIGVGLTYWRIRGFLNCRARAVAVRAGAGLLLLQPSACGFSLEEWLRVRVCFACGMAWSGGSSAEESDACAGSEGCLVSGRQRRPLLRVLLNRTQAAWLEKAVGFQRGAESVSAESSSTLVRHPGRNALLSSRSQPAMMHAGREPASNRASSPGRFSQFGRRASCENAPEAGPAGSRARSGLASPRAGA